MHKLLFYALICLSSLCSNGQHLEPSQRIFWGIGVDQFYNAKVLSSGKIVLLGRTDSHRNGGYQNKDGWVVMLSETGDTLWSKSYGGVPRTDRFWDVEEMENGDLLFVGSSGSFLGSENVYIVRTDSSGNLLNSNNYGDTGFDRAYDIELLEDGGWFIIGESKIGKQESEHPFEILIIRCASDGSPMFMKTLASSGEAFGVKSLIAENNDVYILGHVIIDGRFHLTLQSYTLEGELNFVKTYKGRSATGECATDMILGLNGSIYISGYTIDDHLNGLLLELDTEGTVQNATEYSSTKDLEFMRIVQDTDSTLWTVGYCSKDTNNTSGPLAHLSTDFQVLKARQFQPLQDDIYFSTVRLLGNNQLLLVGSHIHWFGEKRGGYLSIVEKNGPLQPYESELNITQEAYSLEPIHYEFTEKKLTGYSRVQSVEIPVNIEELRVE